MNPEKLAALIGVPLNTVGAAYYFHPQSVARSKELGLDGFRFYVLGRGGVLGDVEAPVIQSAFGWFNGGLIAKMWDSARSIVDPRQAARELLDCGHAIGRAEFSDLDGLDAFNEAAEAVIATTDPAGLALYAGYAAEPLPDDAPARAMQLAITLRELRGSAHLVAVLAAGLTPAQAHTIKRPDMVAQFGWEESPVIEEHHRRSLDQAEELTNKIAGHGFASLTPEQGDALLAGASAMLAAVQND
ncbi:MAG: hypothetical protein HOJ56_02945 [Acidimicrobiaceae bacterium]|nr:hypothetical protein [Acidimicrobiaceae bacterium]